MKKRLMLSAIAVTAIATAHVNAADDLSGMFSQGKVNGQIRAFFIDRDYQGSAGNTTHRSSTALGGNLKYETADYKGLSLGTAFYTTNKVATGSVTDATLFGTDNESYSILGEAYVQYKMQNTVFKGGRQKLDTPLAGSDDARMLPNLFEAYVLTNKDIANTTLMAAHVTKFAQGTFGRAYSNSSAANKLLSVTSGYSYVDAQNQVGDFKDMGEYAVGKSTDGVSIVSATYAMDKNLKVQVWDYYAHDILNAIYAQADLSWKCLLSDMVKPSLSVQGIKENEVGDELAGKIDSTYWAAQFKAKVENFTASIAYSQTDKNSAAEAAAGGLTNAIVTPWGGMPAFTQGMVTRHQFLAGTKATKVAATYNFKDMGANLSTTLYYASFDMDANSGYGIERTAKESGFDVIYNPEMVKKLQLRFRGNFPRKFHESASGDTGWNEYRVIANYNF